MDDEWYLLGVFQILEPSKYYSASVRTSLYFRAISAYFRSLHLKNARTFCTLRRSSAKHNSLRALRQCDRDEV